MVYLFLSQLKSLFLCRIANDNPHYEQKKNDTQIPVF